MNPIISAIINDPNVSHDMKRVLSLSEHRLEAYKDALLHSFDWNGEAIDDGLTYMRWKDELAVLRAEQRAIDPTGAIWLAIMPKRTAAGPQPPLPEVQK